MRDAGTRFAGGRLLSISTGADLRLDLSSDGSGAPETRRLSSLLLALVAMAAVAVVGAIFVASAHAAVIHKPSGTFDLPSFPGSPPPSQIGVDEQGGYVYVLGRYNGNIEKFDLEGNPSAFTGIPGPNEHQGVHFEGGWFGGDAFKLTCPNGESTGEIEWTEEHTVLEGHIKAALEAKCGGTLKVTGFDPYNSDIEFGGTLGHTNLAQISCTKVSGTGTCYTTGGEDGAPSTNKLHVPCFSCYQIAVDNTGGPNQGVIYVASGDNLTTCCPGGQSVPNPGGGIHAYLPSGQPTHSTYKGNPIDPHPFEFEQGHGEPIGLGAGGIYTRSQETFGVRACGVAVDEDGNLIIAHGESSQEFAYIDKLGILPWATNDQQEGSLLGTLNSDTSNPCRLQVDSAGNVYFLGLTGGFEIAFSEGSIKKYPPEFHAPSGTAQIPPDLKDRSTLVNNGPDRSFALDSEDHVYGLRPSGPPRVQQFDQSGSLTETFGAGELIEPADIAIDKATGTAYVTDGTFETGAEDIHIFKAFTVPNSITGPFSGTAQTTGVLNGEVDLAEAGEEVTNCEFEYTSEALFIAKEFEEATKQPCDEGTTFTANESVSTEVSGLTLEEPYLFRLVTENANGASNGSVHKFVPHAVVDLTTKPASNVAPLSATLNASFTGNGDATEYFFEYGHGPAGVYTATTATQSAGNPSGPTQVSLPVNGLEFETTYHYRVVAVNSTGTSKGFDESFTTPPAVAGLTTQAATEIGQQTVTLNAKFTGDGHDTKFFFEYGPTKSYGQKSSTFDAGTTFGTTPISAQISTYFGYSTYHYRVIAENEFGKTEGKDMTFSTEPAPLPGITETSIEDITPTSAHVRAMVAPNRWDASWLFEWGETTGYGTFTETEPILPGETINYSPVEADITGLEPETIYHFRAVAFNFTGVTNGPDQVFRTPAVPKIDSASASAVGQTTAHLSARVVGNLSPTSVHFEYGPSGAYGSNSPVVAIGSDTLARESGVDLTGLAPGTTYHYRVVGSNHWGTSSGRDQTFTTLPGPPAAPPPPAPKTKCPKGKVKRHGKCVPKHKPKKKKKSKRHGRSR